MLQKYLFISISLLFVSCGNIFSNGVFSVGESKNNNELYINYLVGGKTEIVKVYNYIPSSNKLYIKFLNGSLLGYFPVKDETLNIKAWNDKNHLFDLVFCDQKTKKVTILSTGRGWNYHLLDSDDQNKKWVAITPKGDAELFLLNEEGLQSNQVKFQTDICPDAVSFKKSGTGQTMLVFESMDYYQEYILDFVNKIAKKK